MKKMFLFLFTCLFVIPIQSMDSRQVDQELLDAADRGDLDELNKALAAGGNVNARSRNGETPLMWAALRGHDVIIERLLIVPGIKINAQALNCRSAYGVAIEEGHPEIAGMIEKALHNQKAPVVCLQRNRAQKEME